MKDLVIEDLQYQDKKEVRKTLLLYNIITMLNSPKDVAEKSVHVMGQ